MPSSYIVPDGGQTNARCKAIKQRGWDQEKRAGKCSYVRHDPFLVCHWLHFDARTLENEWLTKQTTAVTRYSWVYMRDCVSQWQVIPVLQSAVCSSSSGATGGMRTTGKPLDSIWLILLSTRNWSKLVKTWLNYTIQYIKSLITCPWMHLNILATVWSNCTAERIVGL